MELKKRWIAVIVLVLGLTAALEMSPRTVVIRSTLPPVSTCPCNNSPYGTSRLLGMLRDEGMNITVVTGLGELGDVDPRGYDAILLLVVAADNLGPNYATAALETLEGKGVPLYVAVFDEYPTDGTKTLLSRAGRDLCGVTSPLVIARVFPSNSEATALLRDGARLQTGYTSYLSPEGSDLPLAVTDSPYWGPVHGYTLEAWVWPSSGAVPDKWTPLAASCKGKRGGVLAVADSSIVINMALESSEAYGREAVKMIRGLVGDRRVMVVVDQGMYLTQQARVAVSLHPSFLLVRAGEIYQRLETRVLDILGQRHLVGAIATLAGALVMTFSWASSQSARSLGEKKVRLAPARPREPVPLGCEEMLSKLESIGARRLVGRIEDPHVRAEAEKYLATVEAYCSAGLGERLLWILSGKPRGAEVYRMYVLLLGLLGVEPVYQYLERGGSGKR